MRRAHHLQGSGAHWRGAAAAAAISRYGRALCGRGKQAGGPFGASRVLAMHRVCDRCAAAR